MNKKNLIICFGLMVGLIGVVFYDPLGFLFNGAGLIIIGIGLGCLMFGYNYKRSNWGNIMIGQSILWATAILITAISESKSFTVLEISVAFSLSRSSTLILPAYTSMNLLEKKPKVNEITKLIPQDTFHKKKII